MNSVTAVTGSVTAAVKGGRIRKCVQCRPDTRSTVLTWKGTRSESAKRGYSAKPRDRQEIIPLGVARD